MTLKHFFLLALAAGLLCSCETFSLESTAPSVPPEETLAYRGRRIYLTTCARCHAPEPVSHYSAAEWREILPRMIKDSKLSSADAAAVTSYVAKFSN